MKLNRTVTKFVALVMCLAMVVPCLSACNWWKEIDKNYTGPTFYASIANVPTNFDPMYAYLDDSAAQFLSLIYEGLFRYDENGKPVKALCKSYEWVKKDAETGEYIAEFTIKDTAWSDTVSVTASDFVFAWQRLLKPGNYSEAGALLYDVKNARAVKSGDLEVYDLGAYPVGQDVIRIEFEREVNLDEFIANLASPCLVPMRAEVVDKITDWASTSAIIVSNGPFYLKTFDPDEAIRFERNRNYLRDIENDDMDKYVGTYRVVVYVGDEYKYHDDTQNKDITKTFDSVYELSNFLHGEGILSYYANLGKDGIEKNLSNSEFTQIGTKSTHTYLFNTNHEILGNAKVRKALSMAIDREAVMKASAVIGTPAQGIVPQGVYEVAYGKDATTFRDAGGNLIGAGDIEGAKALLKEAGITSGSFTITVRRWDQTAIDAAEYVAAIWNELGFNVNVDDPKFKVYDNKEQGYDGLIKDEFLEAYKTGNFDVIAVDLQQITNNAFSALSPYATGFCGGDIDLSVQQDEYKVYHKTGYASAEYDKLIEDAFAETDPAKKAKLLHDAEKLLMEEMPVMPLFTYTNMYTQKSNISDIEYDWYGAAIFTNAEDSEFEYVVEEKK